MNSTNKPDILLRNDSNSPIYCLDDNTTVHTCGHGWVTLAPCPYQLDIWDDRTPCACCPNCAQECAYDV